MLVYAMIIHAKERLKQFAAGRESGCRIGDKENQNDDSRNSHKEIFLIVVSMREKVRNGNRMIVLGINPQALCNKQPV